MITRRLYGARSGDWLIIERPGTSFPHIVAGLIKLGPPIAVVVEVHAGLMARRAHSKEPVQTQLAERLGVGQQAISSYLHAASEPHLSIEGWSALVRLHFELMP